MLAGLTGLLGGGGGGATAFDSIQTLTPSAGSTSATFTSIPSTYKHLQIRCISRRNDAGSALGTDLIQFNSDSSANYAWHNLSGDGSTVSAT